MFEGYDLMDKIFVGAMLILLSFMLITALGFPFTARERDAELKECFLQEPKTDDCRFMLWKYEHSGNNCKGNDETNALVQGVATGVMISGGMRAATVH